MTYREVLSISPQDYGYNRWDDRTSDSSWLETIKLARHLPFFDEDHAMDQPQPYPNFIFFDPEPPNPDFKGVVEWVRSGMPSSFPNGLIAEYGLKVWVTRSLICLTEVDAFIAAIRRLPLPLFTGDEVTGDEA